MSTSPIPVFLKVAGKYVGIDPTPIAGKTGDDQFLPYANRAIGSAWEQAELVAHDNGQFSVRFLATNRWLSLTSGGLQSRDAANPAGLWELPFATTQPDGSNLLYRLDDSASPVVTIELRAA